MAEYVTDEMKGEIHEVFQMYVTNPPFIGRDELPVDFVPTFLRTLALWPIKEELLKDVVAKADPGGSGAVSEEALVPLVGRVLRDCGQREVGRLAFSVFDKDNIGTLTPSELRHVMTNLPGDKIAMTDEEFDELLEDARQATVATQGMEKAPDPKWAEDGLVHIDVFCEFMRKFNKDKG
jgi:Ca2+-binding EF-hand superfamily protein